MKIRFALFASACLAAASFAQQTSTTAVKMICRDLSTGTMAPNEALVDGMACHVAGPQADPRIKNIEPKPVAANFVVDPSGPLAANRITAGATVFIARQNGFQKYLAAALQKTSVPLVAVSRPEHATYILTSAPATNVQLIDQKTGAIVFAYPLNASTNVRSQQFTAEACARRLKEKIENK